MAAVRDEYVRDEIVGRVQDIRESRAGRVRGRDRARPRDGRRRRRPVPQHALWQQLAARRRRTAGFPPARRGARPLSRPRPGHSAVCARAPARGGAALTCVALKPQGLGPAALADIARAFALGGVDYIKDDHGIADQAYSPFRARVAACAAACREAAERTGRLSRYVPSLSGHYGAMREQIAVARDQRRRGGDDRADARRPLDRAGAAPRKTAISSFSPTRRWAATRIALPALMRLFRLVGGDAAIFPNYGGRFGYSRETCRAVADGLRAPWGGLRPALPTPAGGMTRRPGRPKSWISTAPISCC